MFIDIGSRCRLDDAVEALISTHTCIRQVQYDSEVEKERARLERQHGLCVSCQGVVARELRRCERMAQDWAYKARLASPRPEPHWLVWG